MKSVFSIFFLLFVQNLIAHADCTDCSLFFIENKGQWEQRIRYKSEFGGGAVFFGTDRLTFALCNQEQKRKVLNHAGLFNKYPISTTNDSLVKFHAYQMVFANANTAAELQPDEQLSEYFNYFLGNDKSKWKGRCKAFRKIIYRDLYDDIDAEIYSQNVGLKYDFYIKPRADISQISIRYDGIENLKIDQNGNLILASSIGDIIEQKPYAYQIINGQKEEVRCAFVLDEEVKTVRFSVKNYDENYMLVIDPHLVFATYSGSVADNFGYTATYDKYGNAYTAGSTFGTGYPTTLGAYQVNYAGGPTITGAPNSQVYSNDDIGITKYNTTGTARIYSTYLGGYGADLPHSLVVNDNDELYLFGTTSASDFPTTVGAYSSSFAGGVNIGGFYGLGVAYNTGSDMVLVRFNSTGTQLLASTYLGGNHNDGLNYNLPFQSHLAATTRHNYADEVRGEIDIAPDGNIVVATTTRSSNFPQTDTVTFSASAGTDADACVTKIKPTLDSIIWSIKIGGSGDDAAYSIAFAPDSSIYVVGGTTSPDFPVPGLGRQKLYGGGDADGWIYHIGKNADTIYSSTFAGFQHYEQIYFVELNRNGDVFVLGQCDSSQSNFIFNAAYNKPNGGQFISKYTPDLEAWDWSTSFGRGIAKSDISPTAFLVDICNSIYVSGWGSSAVNQSAGWANTTGTSGLDVTAGAYQPTTDNHDFYLMILRDDASALQYATFIGGSNELDHVDGGTSRFDRKGIVYQSVCASCGGTSNFPTFPADCVSPTNNSRCNNLVFKFDLDLPAIIADFDAYGCAGANIPFVNLSKLVSENTQYLWSFGDGTTSSQVNPSHSYSLPGTYTVTLRLTDPLSCNISDSITKTIVIPAANNNTLPTVFKCQYDSVQIGRTFSEVSIGTLLWFPSNTLDNPTVSEPFSFTTVNANYTLLYSNNNCVDTFRQQVEVYTDDINVVGGNVLCPNDTLRLLVTHVNTQNILSYEWQPESLISGETNTPNPVVLPVKDTTFYVTATDEHGCKYYDSVFVRVASSLGDVMLFAEPDTILFGDTSQIIAVYDSSIVGFQWSNDIVLSNLTTPNPLAFPRETHTFYLTATDTNGCELKRLVTIVVVRTPCSEEGMFIPNAFTPNGDGKNDIWYVRGNNIKSLTVAVYDRWGQKVFESQNQTDGWDGTFNGKKLDPTVFGYYIEGYCVNEERFFIKGNVTILE